MAINNFKPFAVSNGANVTSQDDYEALTTLSTGFSSGKASSAQVNKALRQGTVIASVLAQFIADNSGNDVLDNGDSEAIGTSLTTALAGFMTNNSLYVDSVYPVGVVMFFAQNKNPNSLFPGTTWTYIGENKTIRLGNADGTDILSTGGADTISLATANLPSHAHTFNATTSAAGSHNHQSGATGDAPSAPSDAVAWGTGRFGTDNKGAYTTWTTSIAPDHTHTLSGTTSSIGSAAAISIQNAFVKLMGWYRSA